MTTQNHKIQEVVGETTECPCCMECFNKRSHKPVTCNCGYTCCITCIKQYFANTTKLPHCMNCKQPWNYKFQYEQLGKNYVNVVYKKQRCELLFDIEKAKIPDTIHIIEHIKELQKTKDKVEGEIKYYEEKIAKELEKEKQFMDELGLNKDEIIEWYNERCSKYISPTYPIGTSGYKRKMKQHSISTKQIHHINEIYELFNKKTGYIRYNLCNNHAIHLEYYKNILYTIGPKASKLYTLYIRYMILNTEKQNSETLVKEYERTIQNIIKKGKLVETNTLKPKKEFIKPCPTEDCKGFLSTQYKCGLCNVKVCPKCFDIIHFTTQSSGDGNPDNIIQVSGPHECKPENIESANMIKKETKACPQCGVPIFKISGCNQMWCTGCNIAFDWRTGNIETGGIHNPHYFDWLKKNGKQGMGNGQPAGCNDHVYTYQFRSLVYITSVPSKTPKYVHIQNKIQDTIYTFANITHVIRGLVHLFREKIVTFDSFRIRYLLNEIDESKFKSLINRYDKQNEEYNDIANILDLFKQVTQENLVQLRTNINSTTYETDELIEMCLDIIGKIAEIYKYCREHVIQYNRCEKTLKEFYDLSNVIINFNLY